MYSEAKTKVAVHSMNILFILFDFLFIEICDLHSKKDRMPETYALAILTFIWTGIFFLISKTLTLLGFYAPFNVPEILIFYVLGFFAFSWKYLFGSNKISKRTYPANRKPCVELFFKHYSYPSALCRNSSICKSYFKTIYTPITNL